MDYCQTCIYYPPSSCDGKPCTQCDPENPFQNCYVKKEADSKPTNADRIRNMGDIELANFLSGLTYGCVNCPMYDEWQIGTADECGKNCNSSWQEWVRKESEDK